MDKHVIQKTDYPHKPKDGSNDDIFSGKKQKKKKKLADYEKGQDKEVYEDKMSKGDMKRKEQIVKGMKKNKADFVQRYGKDAESVMYATANKMASEEIEEEDESLDHFELEDGSWVTFDEETMEAIDHVFDTLDDEQQDEFTELFASDRASNATLIEWVRSVT